MSISERSFDVRSPSPASTRLENVGQDSLHVAGRGLYLSLLHDILRETATKLGCETGVQMQETFLALSTQEIATNITL